MKIIFDIGGTHLRVAPAEDISRAQVFNTPASPEAAIDLLASFARDVGNGEEVTEALGGVAGVIREDGAIINSPNLPAWGGFPFAVRLSERLGEAFVRVENDANLGGLGEAREGTGKGVSIVAYLVLGTGIGGARIVDGVLDRQAGNFEPGHQIIDVGNNLTLENCIGGAALEKKHGKRASELPRELFDSELTPALAAGVWNAIVHWSPEVIILGGSLMNEDTAFRIADVRTEVEKIRRVLPALPDIQKASLGDSSGLHGAAALLNEGLKNREAPVVSSGAPEEGAAQE